MGGLGSGRHSWQSTMESTIKIDIRWLKKRGLLKGYHRGSLKWSNNGNPSGAVSYEMQPDRMILRYKHLDRRSQAWDEVEQSIRFTESPCNYGGTRKWFICPNCLGRVAILAGLGKYFYCRKCYRLPYRSTLETPRDRLCSKKHKLGEEIFEHYEYGDGWLKKKGMHWKTFNKKYAQYKILSEKIEITIEDFLHQLRR